MDEKSAANCRVFACVNQKGGVGKSVSSSKEQIDEYDYSKLGWSADNLLTLITCIADVPELRWAAVCISLEP